MRVYMDFSKVDVEAFMLRCSILQSKILISEKTKPITEIHMIHITTVALPNLHLFFFIQESR